MTTTFGYFLASEDWGPTDLVRLAGAAQDAGFEALWISDHFHPWNDEQGQSPFVWSVVGALSQAVSLPVTTAVTCPTVRMHPTLVAQAAATSQLLLDGRFTLGVGSGEALNEHIHGDPWPGAGVRLEMLDEAIEVMRKLWTGKAVNHRGRHYTVEDARIYSLPDRPPPVYVSAFGAKSMELAVRAGDGFISTVPDADAVADFRARAGADKPAHGGLKVCWGTDRDEAVRTAARMWPNEALPGELAQVLPSPRHFEQAAELVSPEMVAEQVVCGPDIDEHVAAVRKYVDAGFDHVYIAQIGPDQEGFFDTYAKEVLPRLRDEA